MSRRSWQWLRLGAAARLFALVAMLAPALWTRDIPAVVALLAIGVVWLLGEAAEVDQRLPVWPTTLVEPLTVGVMCGLTMHRSTAVLGALAVGPFTAGLRRGRPGAAMALVSGATATIVAATLAGGVPTADEARVLLSSAVAGMGFGLIASFLHSGLRREPDPLAPYHDARELILQLIDVSDGLVSGLDPSALGSALLDQVRDELPTTALALYVPNGSDLTPLVATAADPTVDLRDADLLALRCRLAGRAVVAGHAFAFPLTVGSTVIAVVAGRVSERVDPARIGLLHRTRELGPQLAVGAVHLDTALLFGNLRDRATTVERRRLAREMHDGLAQDIASLGYLVDALAVAPSSPEQAVRIDALRRRITTVVAEVRRSVVTLRTGIAESASLGAALGAVARHLTEFSGIPVHVTLDERETRLRPEVEAELFRIVQQAMTNAVRHSGADAIRVHCHVRPPRAVVTVRDDGRGLQPARPDSQGLDIMRERAALIGARLDVERERPHGTTVTVRLDPLAAAPAAVPTTAQEETAPA